MAKQLFAFCDGPRHGPCPNRVLRLLSEMDEQGATYSDGCRAADVSAQIAALDRGKDVLSCTALEGGDCPFGADKPRFDEELGELWARGVCVHHFATQASTEAAILKNLQDNHWRPKVFYPLGKSKSKKYEAWLKSTVRRLNQCQLLHLIEFHSHPKARAVSWKWRMPEV